MVTVSGVALVVTVFTGVALMAHRTVMAGVLVGGMAMHPSSFGASGIAGRLSLVMVRRRVHNNHPIPPGGIGRG